MAIKRRVLAADWSFGCLVDNTEACDDLLASSSIRSDACQFKDRPSISRTLMVLDKGQKIAKELLCLRTGSMDFARRRSRAESSESVR